MMVVSATAPTEIRSRVRSSRTWSTSDMVPSGLIRLRRWRGSRQDRNWRAHGLHLAAPWRRCVLAGSGRAGVGRVGAGASTRSSEREWARGGLGGRRLRNGRVAGFCSTCNSLTSDLKIRIDLPSDRAASGSRLDPEQNDDHEKQDYPVPRLQSTHSLTSRR